MIKTLCICGAGTMGSGIAQTAAQQGFQVILYDISESGVRAAHQHISKDLQLLADKKKLDREEVEIVLQRIKYTSELSSCRADAIIEAIIENEGAKVSLLQSLEAVNEPETIFASNTSALSISRIAEQTGFPERIAGMHFFNPATRMKLVEIIRTPYTDEWVIDALILLAAQLNKEPVCCTDAPGFIVNRVARPYYLESLRLLGQGVAGIETIDRLATAAGFRMGPFTLMDLIGNDINYAVSCSLYERLGNPERLLPSVIQKEKVEAKALGKKTGHGFYNYN